MIIILYDKRRYSKFFKLLLLLIIIIIDNMATDNSRLRNIYLVSYGRGIKTVNMFNNASCYITFKTQDKYFAVYCCRRPYYL